MSSIRPTRESSVRIRLAPEEFSLRVWPLMQEPVGSLAAIGAAAGLSWLVTYVSQQPGLGFAIAAILAVTLWRTLVPVRYEFAGGGIVQSVFGWRRRIPWTAIRRHVVGRQGVWLFPDQEVTSLSPLRGLFLPWTGHQAEILAHLDYYVQSWNAAGRLATDDIRRP